MIPVIVAEGLGPVAAVKSSMQTLKKEWGTALMGNFSLGMFGFLLMLPVIGIGFLLGTMISVPVAIAVAVPLGILAVLVSATADATFKAYLYSFATGKTLPTGVNTSTMREAFSQR